MTISRLGRHALTSCVAIALLAGCGGSQPPIGAPGAMAQRPAVALPVHGRYDAKSADLLYSSAPDQGQVLIFSYPAGKLLHTLSGFNTPAGLCSDNSGNVFIVDLGAQDIIEYAHGGTKPVATLDDSGNDPNACYVDPMTGDLAVAGGGIHENANIAVFANAQGKPKVYTDGFLSLLASCTYDADGNLFAGGYAEGSGHAVGALVELPANGEQLTPLSVNTTLGAGGAVQWDGKYLAVGSPRGTGQGLHGPATIYQFSISGSTATVVNTIQLSTGKGDKNAGAVEFWIQNGYIVSPKTHRSGIARWSYPAGGDPVKSYPTNGTQLGVTISRGAV